MKVIEIVLEAWHWYIPKESETVKYIDQENKIHDVKKAYRNAYNESHIFKYNLQKCLFKH